MVPVNYSVLIANKLNIAQRSTIKTKGYRSRNLVLTVHSYPDRHYISVYLKCLTKADIYKVSEVV